MLPKSDSELGRVYNFRILGALENEITNTFSNYNIALQFQIIYQIIKRKIWN